MSPRQDPAIIDDDRAFGLRTPTPPRFWSLHTVATVSVITLLFACAIWSL